MTKYEKQNTRRYKQRLLNRLENIVCKIENRKALFLYQQDIQYDLTYLRALINGRQGLEYTWVLDSFVFNRYPLIRKWYYLSMDLDV